MGNITHDYTAIISKNNVIIEVNMARISSLNVTCFGVEAEILLATVFHFVNILKALALSKSNEMIHGTYLDVFSLP